MSCGLRLTLDEDRKSRLRRLAGSGSRLEFLGYVVDLESGEFYDTLKKTDQFAKTEFGGLQVLVTHYSKAEPGSRAGKLVKFADLPGGQAFERAFLRRAVHPIAEAFGEEPEMLVECAEQFGGFALSFGDSSVEVPALPHLPLTIILWRKSEFPATATMLYDQKASDYLPTEDLAVLGELTTARLQEVLGTRARKV